MKIFCEFTLAVVPWLILSLLVILYEDVIVLHLFKFIVYIPVFLNCRWQKFILTLFLFTELLLFIVSILWIYLLSLFPPLWKQNIRTSPESTDINILVYMSAWQSGSLSQYEDKQLEKIHYLSGHSGGRSHGGCSSVFYGRRLSRNTLPSVSG